MKKVTIIKKIVSVVLTATFFLLPSFAIADALEDISDEMSTLKVDTYANHDIRFKTPSGVGTSTDTITINFESDFDLTALSTTSIDIAEGDSGVCSSASYTDKTISDSGTAGSGEWGFAVSSQIITLTPPTNATTGEIDADVCIQLRIGTNAVYGASSTTQIKNTTGTGDKTIAFAGVFGDTGTTTVEMLTTDQVVLSAEVPQSIKFEISETAASFGDLDAGNARWATTTGTQAAEAVAHALVVGTNANSGYTVTVEGATLAGPGTSTIDAITGGAVASNPGNEQFGMKLSASGGSGSVTAPYGTANYAYDADSGTTDQVASADGTTADTTYSVTYIANIASNTDAGSYTATLTYVATANF